VWRRFRDRRAAEQLRLVAGVAFVVYGVLVVLVLWDRLVRRSVVGNSFAQDVLFIFITPIQMALVGAVLWAAACLVDAIDRHRLDR
jgi:hypothetical protein